MNAPREPFLADVAVAHAHPIATAGIAASLHGSGWHVTTRAEDPGCAAVADVVVADYDTGLALARSAPGRHRGILVVTRRATEADVLRACEAGVAGYLLEDAGADELRLAVRHVMNGARYYSAAAAAHLEAGRCRERLTDRETDVLRLLAAGRCDKQIARDLGIGVGTVKWHVHNLMGKLGTTARLQAVVVAARRGIVGLDGNVPA